MGRRVFVPLVDVASVIVNAKTEASARMPSDPSRCEMLDGMSPTRLAVKSGDALYKN